MYHSNRLTFNPLAYQIVSFSPFVLCSHMSSPVNTSECKHHPPFLYVPTHLRYWFFFVCKVSSPFLCDIPVQALDP